MSMYNLSNDQLQARIRTLKKSAEESATLAKSLLDTRRDPTDEQKASVAKGLEYSAEAARLGAELLERQEKGRKSDEIKEALAAIGVDLGLDRPSSKSSSPNIEMLTRSKRWAEGASKALTASRAPGGEKAFVTTTLRVPNLLDGGAPVTIDAPSTTLLDLIGRGQPAGERIGNQHMGLRQTARTNNAGPVPDGGTKPVSIYEFGEVLDYYRYFVNKTEDLPFRYIDDYPVLIDIVKQQLAEDTILAVEEDVLIGDGTGDHFTGILNTSGIQAQAWTTDRLTTLSNAKYKFISQELPFNGWVFNPADLQALELMRENGATGPFLFKSRAEIAAFLGAPIATTAGMPVGRALAGDYTQAELIPLGDDELIVDTQKRTENNTFLMMFEGRYGFRVKKPLAFVDVDLTA